MKKQPKVKQKVVEQEKPKPIRSKKPLKTDEEDGGGSPKPPKPPKPSED